MRPSRPRPILGLPLLALLATASAPLASPAIRAGPVALDRSDPARVRLGGLRYLGGWELASNDQSFGGLSSMVWRAGRLVALSDAGTLFSIGFVGGVPVGRVVGPLPGGPGKGEDKIDRDSESLTTDPATGQMWAGFEQFNQIWRYDAGFTRAEAHARPKAMKTWPSNGGAEAMVRLTDGRFLVFSEEGKGPEGGTALLVFAGDPTEPGPPPALAGYRAPAGYRVTDAAELPDGRLLVLHRRFTLMDGVSAILSILDPATIRTDHAITGREIARLASPLTVDNMEALAVTRDDGATAGWAAARAPGQIRANPPARTIVWIASDDNFSPLQRTLLLKFALIE